MENKEIRIATLGITAEFRKMEVGETVRFPFTKYNYGTVRQAPSTAVANERANEGRMWKTKINWEEKSVDVTRTA